MANLESVPIIDVDNVNFEQLWPSIILAIQRSSFVAMDLEMSGLGDRKKLIAKCMDERYRSMCEVARTRSILSIGISCFTKKPKSEDSNVKEFAYTSQTFNITVLCVQDYVVEPRSLTFLVSHGYDFNKQYSVGIPYHRGDDRVDDEPKISIRDLFSEVVRQVKPIVFHNGLVDLVFIYQNFYANLPPKLSQFIADMAEIFPNGLYDTKYITDYKARMPASYLEYVFKRCQYQNLHNFNCQMKYVHISFPVYPKGFAENMPTAIPSSKLFEENAAKLVCCESFTNHGWCANADKCLNSHDIDVILFHEMAEKAKKKKKRDKKKARKKLKGNDSNGINTEGHDDNTFSGDDDNHDDDEIDDSIKSDVFSIKNQENSGDSSPSPIETDESESRQKLPKCTGHRAGFDAFTTGYILATFMAEYGNIKQNCDNFDFGLEQFKNRIYLCGKSIPMQIIKSEFSKTSPGHKKKIETIRIQQDMET